MDDLTYNPVQLVRADAVQIDDEDEPASEPVVKKNSKWARA